MNTTAIRADWVGRVMDGRFTLLQWLGASDSGGIFLAELHGHPWKRGVIELIPADAADAEARRISWDLAAVLSHPHLNRLVETGHCGLDGVELLYAVTEYSDEVLAQVLLERPLTPDEAGEMLGPVIGALSYLHDYGFVHGHVRPSNIMAIDDRLKLSSDRAQANGGLPGPFWVATVYDAPEIATGQIKPAADIWSLGVTLIEVMTQHPVWDKSPQGEPIVPASIPQPFYAIAQECLRSDPALRCTLNDIKARLQPESSRPQPEPPVPAPVREVRVPEELREPPSAGRKRPLLIAAVLILLVLAATFFVWFRHAQSSSPAASNPASDGVENKGAVADRVMPDVPPPATDTIRGQFELAIKVAVDPQGNVSNAEIDSQGPSRYFANLALQAARKWKFKAPTVGGKPVSSQWSLRFRFTQAATEVTAVQTSP